MYSAIRGYKYQHCPVLSGLNKTELGELVNKFDLNVKPTGVKRRPTGAGAGRRWEVPDRKKTTWKSMEARFNPALGVRLTGLIGKREGVKMIKPKKGRKKVLEDIQGGVMANIRGRVNPERKKLKKAKLKM